MFTGPFEFCFAVNRWQQIIVIHGNKSVWTAVGVTVALKRGYN